MFIREMSIDEFKNFANTHFIGNFHESVNYALLKAEEGYEYEFISYGADEVVGAALILHKKIGNVYFGYSPRGFLIDYSNEYLLEDFTKKIKEYIKQSRIIPIYLSLMLHMKICLILYFHLLWKNLV